MKKFLVSALAALVLLGAGTAFAQTDTATHNLNISIPDLVMIRIVTTDGSTTPFVTFDYGTGSGNEGTYITAIENPGGDWLEPTEGNIDRVEVLVTSLDKTWDVDVEAGAFVLDGLDASDVRVTPTSGTGFTLAAGTGFASGSGGGGWTSLGISSNSYELFVNGEEEEGGDTIEVTYTLTAI